MAGLDATEIRVAGTGRVLVAPKNTAAPANLDNDWPNPWQDLGFTSEAGVEFEQDDKIEPVPSWQSVAPVRFVYEERALNAKFELLQVNQQTVLLYFGGGKASSSNGTIRVEIPFNPQPTEMAVGIEFTDGDASAAVVHRFVMPRAVVTEAEESVLSGAEAVKMPVKFTAMMPDTPEPSPLAIWLMRDPAGDGNGGNGGGGNAEPALVTANGPGEA